MHAPLGQLQLKVKVHRSPDCQLTGGPVGSRPPLPIRGQAPTGHQAVPGVR